MASSTLAPCCCVDHHLTRDKVLLNITPCVQGRQVDAFTKNVAHAHPSSIENKPDMVQHDLNGEHHKAFPGQSARQITALEDREDTFSSFAHIALSSTAGSPSLSQPPSGGFSGTICQQKLPTPRRIRGRVRSSINTHRGLSTLPLHIKCIRRWCYVSSPPPMAPY